VVRDGRLRLPFCFWHVIICALRFPPDRAARIAVGTVAAELTAAPRGVTRVILCCFSEAAADHHVAALDGLGLA
jgi:hypothetical protein